MDSIQYQAALWLKLHLECEVTTLPEVAHDAICCHLLDGKGLLDNNECAIAGVFLKKESDKSYKSGKCQYQGTRLESGESELKDWNVMASRVQGAPIQT